MHFAQSTNLQVIMHDVEKPYLMHAYHMCPQHMQIIAQAHAIDGLVQYSQVHHHIAL